MIRVGIVTPYFQDETTYAALHVARVIQSGGVQTRVFAYNSFSLPVSRAWDHSVTHGDLRDFKRWAHRCDKLVWFVCPPLSLMVWTRNVGIESTIVIVWDRLCPISFQSLAVADRLIAPYNCVSKSIMRVTTRKLRPRVIPWDVPDPSSTVVSKITDEIRVLLPLHDSQGKRVDLASLDTAIFAAHNNPKVVLTVTTGSGMTRRSRLVLKQAAAALSGRLVIIKKPTVLKRLMLYYDSHLTVWPALLESFALVGLNSVRAGTPVICWNTLPMTEVVPNECSLAVSAFATTNLGVSPETRPDFKQFETSLLYLVRNSAILSEFASMAKLPDSRQEQFNTDWLEIVSA